VLVTFAATAEAEMLCLAQGLVALLGDSAHAMQPNLGQGGCMAIEDGYQLAVDLSEAADRAEASGRPVDVEGVLKVRLVHLCEHHCLECSHSTCELCPLPGL
jgi:hypothetical protein